jgi:hypothetical protein
VPRGLGQLKQQSLIDAQRISRIGPLIARGVWRNMTPAGKAATCWMKAAAVVPSRPALSRSQWRRVRKPASA